MVVKAEVAVGGGEDRGGEVPGGEDGEEGERAARAAGLGSSPKMSSKAMATDTKLERGLAHCTAILLHARGTRYRYTSVQRLP